MNQMNKSGEMLLAGRDRIEPITPLPLTPIPVVPLFLEGLLRACYSF